MPSNKKDVEHHLCMKPQHHYNCATQSCVEFRELKHYVVIKKPNLLWCENSVLK